MEAIHDPGGGEVLTKTKTTSNMIDNTPDQGTKSVWTDKSVSGGKSLTRTFEQILEDEKKLSWNTQNMEGGIQATTCSRRRGIL